MQLFARRKVETSGKADCKEECLSFGKKEIHMKWTISLMALAIIVLLAFIFIGQVLCGERIMSYLAFASTLLSIVLSVFAIIYSYFSALEASRQWSDISKAVSVILNTTEHIEDNNKTLLETVITIKGDVKAMGIGGSVNNQNRQENYRDLNIANRVQPNGQEDTNARREE